MQQNIEQLARRHNTRYKLVCSSQSPGEKWHISEWQAARNRWQNIIVNVSLEEAFQALTETGAITSPITSPGTNSGG